MDTTADDIRLAELVRDVFRINHECPFIKVKIDNPTYQYCPKGFECPYIQDQKCPQLVEAKMQIASEFPAPRRRRKAFDFYEEVGEVI